MAKPKVFFWRLVVDLRLSVEIDHVSNVVCVIHSTKRGTVFVFAGMSQTDGSEDWGSQTFEDCSNRVDPNLLRCVPFRLLVLFLAAIYSIAMHMAGTI